MPVPSPLQIHRTPMVRRTAGMAGAPLDGGNFTPDQLATLIAWYRADTLGLANGAAVASWPDSSPNGHTLSQATGAKQPTFTTAALAGLPAVAFASASSQSLATVAFTFNQPVTVLLVGKVGGNGQYIVDSLASIQRLLYSDNAANTFAIYAGGGSVGFNFGPSLTAYNVLHGVFNGANSLLAVNGVERTDTAVLAPAASGITMGAKGGGATNFLNGAIAEAVFYGRVLGLDERQAIVAYLGSKYSIATTVS